MAPASLAATLASSIPGAAAVLRLGGLAYRKTRQRQAARHLEVQSPNRMVESDYIRLGGVYQWVQIRGEDLTTPVMLILHGGPGWPNTTFTLPLRPWEKYFTLVQWDHRGAGKTLGRNGKPTNEDMTFARRVSDAVELVQYLRWRLGVEKVILLAESMGTLTGVPLALQRPDLFSALDLNDLYVNVACNEAHKYQLTLERLRKAGQARGISALERIGPDPRRWDLKAWNTNMTCAFKTNRPIPNLDRTLLFPLVLFSPLYSLRDLYHLFAGFQASTARMRPEILAYDALRLGTRFEVPCFLFQGEQDVITLTGLVQVYFARVEAPG